MEPARLLCLRNSPGKSTGVAVTSPSLPDCGSENQPCRTQPSTDGRLTASGVSRIWQLTKAWTVIMELVTARGYNSKVNVLHNSKDSRNRKHTPDLGLKFAKRLKTAIGRAAARKSGQESQVRQMASRQPAAADASVHTWKTAYLVPRSKASHDFVVISNTWGKAITN
ncbi:hypothetical protein MG293_002172 [Ovis ammon polii]|uniref:Uncharacterized protein n=1 Tax=Ovis ammon polii TaxID=230172 RepID=A0AAD4UNM1_OVIAM|nr:hypothetical protein MG293_002172 [Ovis ammon polii]